MLAVNRAQEWPLHLISAVCLMLFITSGCDEASVPPVFDANIPGGSFVPSNGDVAVPFDGPSPVVDMRVARPQDAQVRDGRAQDSQTIDATIQDAAPPPVDVGLCGGDGGQSTRSGPFRCAHEPASVEVARAGRRYQIFAYEAAHPLATADSAFPCVGTLGQSDGPGAPAGVTEACSVRGVRPWFNVRWSTAKVACENIGWRLCAQEELVGACGGPQGWLHPYGNDFQAGRCNLREAFVADGAESPSEAPTGAFEGCVSADGVYDLTGNLWEWNAEEGGVMETRFYQGAGWQTIAEHHRDTDMQCNKLMTVPESLAAEFASNMVGFRCCRTVE